MTTDRYCATCAYYAPSDDPVAWAECHCEESSLVNPRPTESCVFWLDTVENSGKSSER